MKKPHKTLEVIRELQREKAQLQANLNAIKLLIEEFERRTGERLLNISKTI